MLLMEAGVNDQKGLMEYMRKSSPPPFLLKTYMVVEDPTTDNIISWNADGTAFVVWQTAEFAKNVLPKLFKHCNFSSFVRQLNTYGFRKVATSRWEFCNDKFQKGEKEKLCEIRRRKAWKNKQRSAINERHELDEDERSFSSNSSSSDHHHNNLLDENKRLKNENGVLNSELASMKKKCKELIDLVSKYANNSEKQEVDKRPKLFGVRLEVDGEGEGEGERKRKRVEEISETASVLLSQSCK